MYKINIIGAGFVGLTLAQVLSESTNVSKVNVVDVDINRINSLKNHEIYVSESGLTLESDKLEYNISLEESNGGIYFVCVGTPNVNGIQNATYLMSAVKNIVSKDKNALIIIKSTTLPENLKIIEEFLNENYPNCALVANPEFLAEGTAVHDMRWQNMLIVGTNILHSDINYNNIIEVFESIFEGTYTEMFVTSLYEAMLCKYFLNSYKAYRLNFINEFNSVCKVYSSSYDNIIGVVMKDPVMGRGFTDPGLAFGGSCFPKDTEAIGRVFSSAKLANLMNKARIEEFINLLKDIKGKVVIGGKAFKVGTNDIRESVAVKIGDALISNGCEVVYYDRLPELSDVTLDYIKENKSNFSAAILINELPEFREIFKGGSPNFIDCRIRA